LQRALLVWKLIAAATLLFGYSSMSTSPPSGQCPDFAFVQKAGHTPQPKGVWLNCIAKRPYIHDLLVVTRTV
jgi:hypothetical protein